MNRRRDFAVLLAAVFGVAGCESQRPPAGRPVTTAWEESRPPESASSPSARVRPQAQTSQPTATTPSFDPIAMINGSPLNRAAFDRLLLDSYGLALFEQLVMLEAARQKADAAKLKITDEDIDAEYQRALRRMSLPPAGLDAKPLDDATSEALLQEILTSKNIPRKQYMLSIERNTYLRKLVEKGLVVKDDQIRAAFDRLYGERVQVRHIQLASLAEAAKVREVLDKGADFAEAAKKHSRNTITGANGGLLRPFTRKDREFPPLVIEVAFALQEGQVSRAVHWGRSFHLVKLVKRFPKTKVAFEDVKDALTARVREELIVERMQQMADTLLREATVRIFDDELNRRFRAKYPK